MPDDKSSPIERGKRLKLLRSMSGLSKKAFCAKYKISSTSLHYWEHGVNSGISEKGAQKIVDALRAHNIQCTVAWLTQGLGMHPQFIDVRYSLNSIADNNQADFNVNSVKIIHYEIERFRQLNVGAIALAITDDAMDPFYRIGDYVGGKKKHDDFSNKLLEHDCIVETEDKQVICRRLAAGSMPGLYNLYCLNPKTSVYPPILYNIKLISIAPIIRVWRGSI